MLISYSKGRKTFGFRSLVANFSQLFYCFLTRRSVEMKLFGVGKDIRD